MNRASEKCGTPLNSPTGRNNIQKNNGWKRSKFDEKH